MLAAVRGRVALGKPGRLLIYGGAPGGRDEVHAAVSRLPGWKRVPGNSRWRGAPCSVFMGPLNVATAIALSKTPLPLECEPEAAKALEDLRQQPERAAAALNSAPKPIQLPPSERPPFPHQLQALHALEAMGWRAQLADDMGLGKTATALWAAWMSTARRLTVICPASVKWNWKRELAKTLGDKPYPNAIVLRSGPKRRAEQFVELRALRQEDAPGALILNYDLLLHLTDAQREELRAWASQFLILDESHYVKDRTAERTKRVMALEPKHVLLLTGTPVRNTVADLFTQIELVAPGTFQSWWHFQERFLQMAELRMGTRTVRRPVGTKNQGELQAIVNLVQIRRMKEDVLDLPPKLRTVVELELDAPTKRVYKAMRDWWLLSFKELASATPLFAPAAKSALEAMLRLEQIAQGFLGGVPDAVAKKIAAALSKSGAAIPGRPNEFMFPDSAKVIWLLETLRTLRLNGKRAVVFSRFNAPLWWLEARLPEEKMRPLVLHGGLSAEERQRRLDLWHAGDGDVLLVQVKLAEGWNATSAQDAIFLGRDWSPAINAQAEDRLHRIGQLGTVHVQIPVVIDTIEKLIHKRLSAKAADAELVLATMTIGELRDAL